MCFGMLTTGLNFMLVYLCVCAVLQQAVCSVMSCCWSHARCSVTSCARFIMRCVRCDESWRVVRWRCPTRDRWESVQAPWRQGTRAVFVVPVGWRNASLPVGI